MCGGGGGEDAEKMWGACLTKKYEHVPRNIQNVGGCRAGPPPPPPPFNIPALKDVHSLPECHFYEWCTGAAIPSL